MKSRKQIRQRLEQFYEDVKTKRKGKKMRMQVDQEFQQIRTDDLNKQNNVQMFTTSVRCRKAFAAEQKIRAKNKNCKTKKPNIEANTKKK